MCVKLVFTNVILRCTVRGTSKQETILARNRNNAKMLNSKTNIVRHKIQT
jgi:hypothetical protein